MINFKKEKTLRESEQRKMIRVQCFTRHFLSDIFLFLSLCFFLFFIAFDYTFLINRDMKMFMGGSAFIPESMIFYLLILTKLLDLAKMLLNNLLENILKI